MLKRSICLILALLMLMSTLAIGFNSFAAAAISLEAKATKSYTYKLTWKYDSGATLYYVYVDGKLDGTKKINSDKSYTFTTDPYTAGVKHTIQVKAEKNGKIFAESAKLGRYLAPKVPTLSFKTNADGYTISAKVDSGTVHAYQLYKLDPKTDKYVFYKDFKKSVTLKTDSSAYKDTYKARAYVKYAKTYYSQYSSILTCTPKMETVNLTSVKATGEAGKLKCSWKAVSGDNYTGYQIQYSSYDSFGTCRKQDVEKGKTSYTLKLVPGICYKVRMRTYRKIGEERIYGSWSKTYTKYTKASVSKKVNVKDLLNKKVKLSDPGATGNEKLNNVLDKILDKLDCGPKSKLKTYDKVRLCYRYIATEQFKKDGDLKAKGNKSGGTYAERATLQMIENKGKTGSCYEYNHFMHYLCVRMGLTNTYVVDGTVSSSGGGRTGHWWMMMKIGDNSYYYDPRMQRYMTATDLNFFNLPMNGDNKYSDYFRFYDAKAEIK